VAVVQDTVTRQAPTASPVVAVLEVTRHRLFIWMLTLLLLSAQVGQYRITVYMVPEVTRISSNLLLPVAVAAATLERPMLVAPVRLVAAECIAPLAVRVTESPATTVELVTLLAAAVVVVPVPLVAMVLAVTVVLAVMVWMLPHSVAKPQEPLTTLAAVEAEVPAPAGQVVLEAVGTVPPPTAQQVLRELLIPEVAAVVLRLPAALALS
jgi:hypothetical protein